VTDISFKYLEKKHSRKVVGQKIWPIEKKRKHRLKVRKTEGSPNRGGGVQEEIRDDMEN
jgi:hypothetical protein